LPRAVAQRRGVYRTRGADKPCRPFFLEVPILRLHWRVLGVLVLTLCSQTATVRAEDSPKAFAPARNYDFGTVKQGEKVSHCFKLENRGSAPFKTVRMELSLPDMTARVPGSIPAGKPGEACIELDTSKLSLKVRAQALLFTNDPSQPQIPLLMTGVVKQPIDLIPMGAVFAGVWKEEGGQSTLTIVNNRPKPLQVRGLRVEGQDFKAQLQTEKPGEVYQLVVTIPRGLTPGSHTGRVDINTDSARYALIRVPINILVNDEIYAFPQGVDFGSIDLAQIGSNPAATNLAEWFLVKKHTGKFKIKSITSDVPGLKIKQTPEGESNTFRVDVIPTERLQAGSLAGKIQVLTDDPAIPQLVLRVTGDIHASPQGTASGSVDSKTSASDAKSSNVPQASADSVVATVAGQPIYEQDLEQDLGGELRSKLQQVRNQEYQIKSQALDELIRKRIVEAEAKKRGLTVDKLYETEVDAKILAPSDAEVEGYYLAIKAQVKQPLQEVKPQVQATVKMLKQQQARQEYADSLRAKTEVAVLLGPPKTEVGYDPARVRGDARAPVTIVEFSDFQCPYCKQTEATLKDLLAKYNGQVKLAFRDFPLRPIHSRAETAAEAGRCAQEQGKFWEYHDALFEDQSKLDDAGLAATAQKLGLDGKSFQSCLASGKYKAQIEQDEQDGKKAGVNGTPGFFIDGVFLNGAQPQAEFEKIINSELAALKSQNAARAVR
jgi:protein-disulfide isomerase